MTSKEEKETEAAEAMDHQTIGEGNKHAEEGSLDRPIAG